MFLGDGEVGFQDFLCVMTDSQKFARCINGKKPVREKSVFRQILDGIHMFTMTYFFQAMKQLPTAPSTPPPLISPFLSLSIVTLCSSPFPLHQTSPSLSPFSLFLSLSLPVAESPDPSQSVDQSDSVFYKALNQMLNAGLIPSSATGEIVR